jgi:hypothetical protein
LYLDRQIADLARGPRGLSCHLGLALFDGEVVVKDSFLLFQVRDACKKV